MRAVEDTAYLAAFHRAVESLRPDAHFSDPMADRLSGDRGIRVAAKAGLDSGVLAARTLIFDRIVETAVSSGIRHFLNLGAGMDTRPYRMALPRDVMWIEIDLPAVINDKLRLLADIEPKCDVLRSGLDITDRSMRAQFKGLFPTNTIVITEGLLAHLHDDDVASLARDLSEFRYWATDLGSPAAALAASPAFNALGLSVRFAPPDPEGFFRFFGWETAKRYSTTMWAKKIGRCHADAPEEPWAGVHLMVQP